MKDPIDSYFDADDVSFAGYFVLFLSHQAEISTWKIVLSRRGATLVVAEVPVSAGFGHWGIKSHLVDPAQELGNSPANFSSIIDVDWLVKRLRICGVLAAKPHKDIPTTIHLVWPDIDKPSQTIGVFVGTVSFFVGDLHLFNHLIEVALLRSLHEEFPQSFEYRGGHTLPAIPAYQNS